MLSEDHQFSTTQLDFARSIFNLIKMMYCFPGYSGGEIETKGNNKTLGPRGRNWKASHHDLFISHSHLKHIGKFLNQLFLMYISNFSSDFLFVL